MICMFCLNPLDTARPRPRVRECACGLLYSQELLDEGSADVDRWNRIARGDEPGFEVERTPGNPPSVVVTAIPVVA